MDVTKFRDTGELSDICITVDGVKHRLHKFPLYTKSNYFKEALQHTSCELIDLPNFPGSNAIFNLVADYCYGKHVHIDHKTIVYFICAAEYLSMSGHNNLQEYAEKYLHDYIGSLRISKNVSALLDMLKICAGIKEMAEKSKTTEKCFGLLAEIWISPTSRFTAPAGRLHDTSHRSLIRTTHNKADDSRMVVLDKLISLPLDFIVQFIKFCSEKESQLRSLASFVVEYLGRVFDIEFCKNKADLKHSMSGIPNSTNKKIGKGRFNKSKNDDVEIHHNDLDVEEGATEDDVNDLADSDTEADVNCTDKSKCLKDSDVKVEHQQEELKLLHNAGVILDAIITQLPDSTPLSEVITVDWIRHAIQISETYGCECRIRLLQLVGNVLHKLSNEELKTIPSNVLCDIIDNIIKNEKIVPEVLVCVLDSYLHDLARKRELSVDDFMRLVSSVPANYRSSHDDLYIVMEQLLLNSEQDIPTSQKEELMRTVDLSKCSENTLQRALDKNMVPAKEICQAAINLAISLRAESEQNNSSKRSLIRSKIDDVDYAHSKSYNTTSHNPYSTTMYGNHNNDWNNGNDSYHGLLQLGGSLSTATFDPRPYPSIMDEFPRFLGSEDNLRSERGQKFLVTDEPLRTDRARITSNYDHYMKEKMRYGTNLSRPSFNKRH